MAATEDQIADAVADELNLDTQPWAPLVNAAQRGYDNVFNEDGGDLTTLRVVVIPLTLANVLADRQGVGEFDYEVVIDLQQKVRPGSTVPDLTAEVQDLNALAEQVHDAMRLPHLLDSNPAFMVRRAERPEVFVPLRLWRDRVWESYVNVTVRVYR